MLANTRQTYGLVAQVLHWITALLVITLLVLGVYMHELPIDTDQQVAEKTWLYSLHKTLGILAFTTAVIRVIWACFQLHPQPINGDRKLESLLAGTIHWLLYGSIILMPVTGWLHHAAVEGFAPIWWPFSQDLPFVPKDPALAEFFAKAHFLTALLLMGSLFLHIAGAAKHVVVDRDQTLARMIPGKVVKFEPPVSAPTQKHKSRLVAGLVFAGLLGIIFADQLISVRTDKPVVASQPAGSTNWAVDHSKSELSLEVIQGGKPVSGSFPNWQAAIQFDPDNLESSSVKVSVEIASLKLGSISQQAISKDFLNAAAHPQAEFSSDKFIKVSDGKFEAEGQLMLVGQSNPLILPFDLKIEDGRAFMTGVVEIERLDFGIGQKGFTTDGMLGFTVLVKVNLEADQN